jgi:SDR family mycofactocin-dependent oxidoreductase
LIVNAEVTMSGRLAGKVVFITGAARGQGREHVLRMAKEGANVVAVDLMDPAASNEFAQTAELARATGRDIIAKQADVRDAVALSDIAAEAWARFGRIDVLVANAGIIAPPRPLMELPFESFQRTMDVNVYGAFHSCRAVVPHMIAGARGGSIILTSSILGLKAYVSTVHYTVSKHAVVGMMRAMAVELAPHFIRVNSLHPTTVDTPMLDSLRPPGVSPEQNAVRLTSLNMLPVPWVEAADMANAAIFLASDESRYITGVTLPVDAGAMLK